MTRSRRAVLALPMAIAALAAADYSPRVAHDSPRDKVNELATAFLRGRTEYGPESARSDTGWMAPLASRISDNSLAGLAKWHRFQDSILTQLLTVDSAAIVGTRTPS